MKTLIMTIATFIFVDLIGQNVVEFNLKDLDNKTQTFASLKGEKITLIDFWASWCKPCNKALPELNAIYDTYKDKGVQIIGINCDGPRSVSKVMPLVKSHNIKYPILLDLDAEVMNSLNLSAYPSLILVDGAGKIVWIHEGFVSGDTEIIISEIQKHL